MIDLNNSKIFITGGSGFVGANLVRTIIKKYPKAKINLLLRHESNTWRIKDILRNTQISVTEGDLRDGGLLQRKLKILKPEVVFHLACYGGYSKQNIFMEAVETNVLGIANLVNALEKIDFKIFVNTGTSSEYGYKKTIMKEKDVLVPNSYYSASKAGATYVANTYGLLNNRPIITFRLFSVFGPYEEPGRFVPTAIYKAINNQEINVVRGMVRDFIYVEDVVNAYFLATKLKNFDERIFNLCTGKQISIEKAARRIVKLSSSKSKISIGTYQPRPWDTKFWIGDNKLARRVLKWRPKYSFDQGIRKTSSWLKNNQKYYQS